MRASMYDTITFLENPGPSDTARSLHPCVLIHPEILFPLNTFSLQETESYCHITSFFNLLENNR